MLISGKEKLERMRDGRAIYIGAERVDDVTRHPAFRNAAGTIADLYEFKADPDRRDLFSFEENGERYGLPWLRCRTREDLARRMRAMKAIADATYGLIGRSPDHVAGLITGLAMKPALLDALTPGFGGNLTRYYEHARKNDLYVSFAVTPPAGIRSREIFTGEARDDPTLQVIAEGDDGVTISGMKMLATGAVFADEVWIGNLTPIDDKRASESITCALPVNTPGVSFWARASPMSATPATRPIIRSASASTKPTWCWSATSSRCRGSTSSYTTTGQCRAASISRRRRTATRTTNPTCASGPRWG
jgi:4-hydroxyphenylacetate 3-monooxygenase